MNGIISRIYELIAKSGISKSDLADKIGVSRNTIQNWKKFDSYPTLTVIERICEVFGITVEQFFSGLNKENGKTPEENFLEEWRMLSDTEKSVVANAIEAFKKSK